jgi:hypothetical protein
VSERRITVALIRSAQEGEEWLTGDEGFGGAVVAEHADRSSRRRAERAVLDFGETGVGEKASQFIVAIAVVAPERPDHGALSTTAALMGWLLVWCSGSVGLGLGVGGASGTS